MDGSHWLDISSLLSISVSPWRPNQISSHCGSSWSHYRITPQGLVARVAIDDRPFLHSGLPVLPNTSLSAKLTWESAPGDSAPSMFWLQPTPPLMHRMMIRHHCLSMFHEGQPLATKAELGCQQHLLSQASYTTHQCI